MSSPADAAAPRPPRWVWAERTGERRYVGRNARGAEVTMAPQEVDGAFTPGELLAIALAGCAGMSADKPLTRRLGEDVTVTIDVQRTKHPTEDRYAELAEQIALAVTGLSDEEFAAVQQVARRAIEASCTVGNTLRAGATIDLTFTTP